MNLNLNFKHEDLLSTDVIASWLMITFPFRIWNSTPEKLQDPGKVGSSKQLIRWIDIKQMRTTQQVPASSRQLCKEKSKTFILYQKPSSEIITNGRDLQ